MKCDKCGMHEANCHYTMLINGRTTERHLCSQCAGEMGIEQDVFGDFRNLFDDMFGGFFGGRALDPWSELTAGRLRRRESCGGKGRGEIRRGGNRCRRHGSGDEPQAGAQRAPQADEACSRRRGF